MPPPRFVDPAEAIAQICEIRGDYEAAIACYEKVIAIEKADWHETQGEAIDAPQRSIARLRAKSWQAADIGAKRRLSKSFEQASTFPHVKQLCSTNFPVLATLGADRTKRTGGSLWNWAIRSKRTAPYSRFHRRNMAVEGSTSRAQTVSNWETGKSYPDIHSLLLLSALFDVSLDQLIKGDLETMKQEVNAADVKAMNRDAIIYTVLLAATIILPVPLIKWFGLYGLIPELLLWGSAMYFALRLERIKKANNVQSYREILAFSEGKRLDEIEQKVEAGKRPYQKVLLALLTAGITLLVGMVLSWLLL